jgi:hypothetical protein
MSWLATQPMVLPHAVANAGRESRWGEEDRTIKLNKIIKQCHIEFKLHINTPYKFKEGNYMNKRKKHTAKFSMTEANASF